LAPVARALEPEAVQAPALELVPEPAQVRGPEPELGPEWEPEPELELERALGPALRAHQPVPSKHEERPFVR
jgi:hypothetical protein